MGIPECVPPPPAHAHVQLAAAGKKDGWEVGWLGRRMVGKKDGWVEG